GKVVTINGDDATIARSQASGTADFRILEVASTGKLSLGDVIIEDGRTPDGPAATEGPAGDGGDGAGIYNAGVLSLTGTYVQLNATGNGGDGGLCASAGNGGRGGGIFSIGTTTITRGSVSGNRTGAGGAGGECEGP